MLDRPLPPRIPTTHVGSLPRPPALLDAMTERLSGGAVDAGAYDALVRREVEDIVRRQAACGLDIVADGEMSKPGFFKYVEERLSGFEPRPDAKVPFFAAEVAAFPEYYKDYFDRAMTGGAVAPAHPLFCVGPVGYCGQAALQTDLDNLKHAIESLPEDRKPIAAFVPSVAPSGAGYNDYYKTEEEYFEAVGEAMRTEYLAIIEAGFLLQVDDPFLSDIFADPTLDERQMRRKADLYVETVNHALRGIDPSQVRFHTCYGINDGPRIHEAALADVAGHMLRVNAGAYSFEAANSRHEHEYHLWETIKLQDGKILLPGVITHAGNIVEHPELIAERILRFADLVGRDNVMASADCGFSSQATYKPEVHPTVMWAKFEALVEGAKLATAQLW